MADLASKPAAYKARTGLDTQSSPRSVQAPRLSTHPADNQWQMREAVGSYYRLENPFPNAIGNPTVISTAK